MLEKIDLKKKLTKAEYGRRMEELVPKAWKTAAGVQEMENPGDDRFRGIWGIREGRADRGADPGVWIPEDSRYMR